MRAGFAAAVRMRTLLLAALSVLGGGRAVLAGEATLVTAESRWEDEVRLLELTAVENGLRVELVTQPERMDEDGLEAVVVLHLLREEACYWPALHVRDAAAKNALRAVVRTDVPVLPPRTTSPAVRVPLPDADGEWALHGACTPRLERILGGRGGPALDLNKPRGLAVLPEGRVVVADKGNDRIVVLGQDGLIAQAWKRARGDERPFSHPVDVDRDPATGSLYVADLNHRRIVVMDSTGRLLRTLPAEGEEPLGRPVDLAVDGLHGRVYVLDAAVPGLVVLDLEGKRVAAWGGFEAVGLKLSIPLDVELDAQHRPMVSDGGTGAVHVLSPVDGRPVSDFGARDGQGVSLRYPSAIVALEDGRLLVADFAADRVRLLSREGRELSWFGIPGEFPGGVNYPADAKLHGTRLYIAETATDTVSVFEIGEWLDRAEPERSRSGSARR